MRPERIAQRNLSVETLEERVTALEDRPAVDADHDRPPNLWKVVSVDNGTCTVKAVYDSSENVIDATARAGIHYDAGNAPSADDLGTILRLGDGSLFFFSRGAAAGVVDRGLLDWSAV